jgi:hypothetical protein
VTITIPDDIAPRLVTIIEEAIDDADYLTHMDFLSLQHIITQCGATPQKRNGRWERKFSYTRK